MLWWYKIIRNLVKTLSISLETKTLLRLTCMCALPSSSVFAKPIPLATPSNGLRGRPPTLNARHV